MSIIRLALLPLALLLLGAAPGPTVIPLPEADDEALVIPADSPVKFVRFGKYGVAHFGGSIVLTGTFTYGCAIDCGEPVKDRFYRMDFTPDQEMVNRLPHWRVRTQVPSIVITNERAFVRAVTSPKQFAGLHRGEIADIRGRTTILVDHFEAAIECDSPVLTARFVRIIKAPKLSSNTPDGAPGCG